MQGEKQRGGSGFMQEGKQTSSVGLAWDIPMGKPQAAQKKSLIIPGKLQVDLLYQVILDERILFVLLILYKLILNITEPIKKNILI